MPAWSRAAFAVALVALLLVAGPTTAFATAAPPAATSDSAATTVAMVETSLQSNTTYRIDMQAGGNATWTITLSFRLQNESHREGFETIADEFKQGAYLTTTAFEQASGAVSDATGRPMRIVNVSRRTHLSSERGQLVLSFTWTNFGYIQDGKLHVDDVFRTENRLFPGLAEGETMIITRPPGYQFVSASTNIQNRTLRWDGPHSFAPNEPYVVFDEIPLSSNTTTTPGPVGPVQSGNTIVFALAGLVLLGALAAVAYVVRQREEPLFPAGGAETEPETDAQSESTTDEPAETPTESTAEPPGGDAAEADDADETDEIDEELLSDEERVERLLEANGGRMKQANIVQETGWSNAKVSQLLSAMDDDDRIEKLRIGRENLISFPENDADDAEA